MGDAKRAFLAQWGRDYGYGGRIDALYEREVAPRMAPHEHYLDYTGSSLYCSSVLENVFDDLQVRRTSRLHRRGRLLRMVLSGARVGLVADDGAHVLRAVFVPCAVRAPRRHTSNKTGWTSSACVSLRAS